MLREILQNKYITNIKHSASKAAGHVFPYSCSVQVTITSGTCIDFHVAIVIGFVLCPFIHRSVHSDFQVRLPAVFMNVTEVTTFGVLSGMVDMLVHRGPS